MAQRYGYGLAFPFAFSQDTGSVERLYMSSDAEESILIGQSIQIILATAIGSRAMRRDFGSELPDLVFHPNDMSLQVKLRRAIIDTVLKYEGDRVRLDGIEFETDIHASKTILIRVSFTIIRSKERSTITVPFISEA